MPAPDAPAYASAQQLLVEIFQGFLPPRKVSTAEYAEQHRWVKRPGAGSLLKFSHEEAPYLRGIMDALDAEQFLTVGVVGCAQSGKNVSAENWLQKAIEADPADMLWYMQTEDAISAYVKGRLEPMIEAHPGMARAVGTRASDNSIHFKRFGRMQVEFLGASARNFVNKTVARIVADEVDAWDESLGDPKVLLDYRRQVAGADSKLLLMSHPDRAKGLNPTRDWDQGIMSVYRDSDRRTWWWECPHCGGHSSPHPTTRRRMTLDYPVDATLEEIAAKARLICPVNGCVIEDHERRAMNRTGRWLCEGEEMDEAGNVTGTPVKRDTAGFWILGVMSPFILGGIGGLARAREKARREQEQNGDDQALRQVMVKGWGIPYAPPRQIGAIEATVLAERSEPALRLGHVPEGVRVLTTAVDVQANRFELLTRGWGPGGESWVVDQKIITAETATSAAAWDDLIELLANLAYPLADGSGRVMRVRASGFDSGGQAGVTEQAYAAWLRARRRGLARLAGRVDGRDAWMLVPLKGGSSIAASRINLAYPDAARKDRKASARGQVPVLFFNPNLLKDALAAQLARVDAGPGHIHIPSELRSAEPPHAWFEQLAAERRRPNGQWEKINPTARNEVTDLMVMADALARLHGLPRIVWERPPAWAAAWDVNSMVGMPQASAAASGSAPPDTAALSPGAAVSPILPAPAVLAAGKPVFRPRAQRAAW
jgi:phage terminase large subunit GpA-like protein